MIKGLDGNQVLFELVCALNDCLLLPWVLKLWILKKLYKLHDCNKGDRAQKNAGQKSEIEPARHNAHSEGVNARFYVLHSEEPIV